MSVRGAGAAAAAGLSVLAGACQPNTPPLPPAAVQIEARAAQVQVIPEERADVQAEVRQVPGAPPLEVARQDGRLVITDGVGRGDCAVPRDARPVVVLRTPREAEIAVSGAVGGEIGPAAGLRLTSFGCGDWRAESVNGRMELLLRGPGSIEILSGITPRTNIHLVGDGRIVHHGQAGSLQAEVDGSGRIHVARVTGQVARKAGGAGEVTWGRPEGRRYCGGVDCMRVPDATSDSKLRTD